MQDCDWYFDLISPFAYLQWKSRDRLAGVARLRPIPIVLGAVLGHWGQKGPAEVAPKRLHTYRAAWWRAGQLGLPFRMPPAHPFSSLAALRLAVALDASDAAVDALFDAAFGEGRDLSDPAVLADIGGAFGIDDVAAAIGKPEIRERLRANTDAAIRRGVFGVPMMAVGDDLFWGEDMTAMLVDRLANPARFDTPELERLRDLPVGIRRH